MSTSTGTTTGITSTTASSTSNAFHRGDMVCRDTDWIDIVKFFFLNYGLHAITVVTEPGTTPIPAFLASVISIFMPSCGVASAFDVLRRYVKGGTTDLEVAQRAGALCMLVPASPEEPQEDQVINILFPQTTRSIRGTGSQGSENFTDRVKRVMRLLFPMMFKGAKKEDEIHVRISTAMTEVHGQYPKTSRNGPTTAQLISVDNKPSEDRYCLVEVPHWFTVRPLINDGSVKDIKHKLSCNYSAVKKTAAILQILYGSFELYRVRGDQVERWGYAAYSLTVIPYILMSLANLLASLIAPQYPTMFIVYYRGKTAPPSDPNVAEASTTNHRHTGSTFGSQRSQSPGPFIPDIDEKRHYDMEISTVSQQPATTSSSVGENYPAGWWSKDVQDKIEKRVSGAVGEVYGDFADPHQHKKSLLHRFYISLIFLFWTCVTAAPYVIIRLLTGFRSGQSTRSQRTWIICWIVIGQVGASFASFIMQTKSMRYFESVNPKVARSLQALVTVLFSVATLGGFVVVAQMMSRDRVCYLI